MINKADLTNIDTWIFWLVGFTCVAVTLPIAVTLFVDLITDLFSGTLFNGIFANGLIVYGPLALVIVLFTLSAFKLERLIK